MIRKVVCRRDMVRSSILPKMGNADSESTNRSQEVEGIGGVVKKKMKTRMKVGAPVREWEDEREGGQLLGREISGRERSWCAWCDRVVPGQADLENPP